MSDRQRQALWLAISALFAGLGIALWFYLFEKRIEGEPWQSEAALENPMLAATTLLKQHRFSVRQSDTLEQALTPALGKGNLFINASSGDIDEKQMKALMKWVGEGNTLLFQPRWSGKLDIVRSAREGECGKMAIPDDNEQADDEDADEAKPAAEATGEQSESKPESTSESKPDSNSESNSESNSDSPKPESAARPDSWRSAARLGAADATPEGGGGRGGSSRNAGETAGQRGNTGASSADDAASSSRPASSAPRDNEDDILRKLEEQEYANERAQEVDSGKPDQIARKLKLELRRIQYQRENRKEGNKEQAGPMRDAPCVSQLRWPGSSYDLRIDSRYGWFKSLPGAPTAQISDSRGEAVRVYAEGRGRIVLVAENYFNNRMLATHDHAELLLHLLQFDGVPPKLTIVQHLSTRQWYEKLWDHFPLMLVSFALLLALLFWSAVRRFGAVLPLPEPERRALLEHVEASGRWLWQVEKGAQTMLDAMRRLVDKTLSRRVPQLSRLSPPEQLELLTQATGMNRLALELALFKPAATLPQQFIRQIHTLQQLRKHYER